MPLLLYGCETWILYRHQMKQLRTIQQRHLKRIRKIRWDDFISNDKILKRTNTDDIKIMLVRSRIRLLGHVSRMDNDKTVKCLLYGELNEGMRPVGRPKLRYKDTCKSILKTGDACNNWHHFVTDQPLWK